MELSRILKSNPSWALLSKNKLIKTLKAQKIVIPKLEIEEHYKKSFGQIFKKRNKTKFFRINAMPYSFQIDLVLLTHTGRTEQFLLLIDILSRKAFAYVLLSGKMSDVIEKYQIFRSDAGHHIKSVSGDDFFNNVKFKELNESKFTKVYTCVAKENHKAHSLRLGILDRAVRTLKMYILKRTFEDATMRMETYLNDIVDLYNNTPHSSVKNKSPREAYEDRNFLMDMYLENRKYNNEIRREQHSKFKIGDQVRVFIGKENHFTKERQTWSSDILTIVGEEGNSYILKETKIRYMGRELLRVDSSQLDVGIPRIDVGIPQLDVGIPRIDVGNSQLDVGIPRIDVGNSQLDVGIPQIDVGNSQLVVGIPRIDVGIPQLDVVNSQLDVGIPQLDVGKPRKLRDRSKIRSPCWYEYKELVRKY